MILLLLFLWFALNSRFSLEVVLVGLAVCGAVFAFTCLFLHYDLKKECRVYRCLFLLIVYVLNLIWAVIEANVSVAGIIFNRKKPIEQTLITVHIPLKTAVARTLMANTITLTPGTITVKQEGDAFTVHCLDRSLLDGIEESVFVHLLRKMEA